MTRRVVRAFSIALIVAVVAPPFRDPPRDSYPLSTYPMFSHPREAITGLDLVVAEEPGGERRRLPPEVVGGSTEVVHAAATLARAIRTGDTDRLCREIADRSDAPAGTVLEVRTEVYDVVGWFDGDRTPRDEKVHSTCRVPR